jgi:hypothetical protein
MEEVGVPFSSEVGLALYNRLNCRTHPKSYLTSWKHVHRSLICQSGYTHDSTTNLHMCLGQIVFPFSFLKLEVEWELTNPLRPTNTTQSVWFCRFLLSNSLSDAHLFVIICNGDLESFATSTYNNDELRSFMISKDPLQVWDSAFPRYPVSIATSVSWKK